MVHRILKGEWEEPSPALPLDIIEDLAGGGVLKVHERQTAALVAELWPVLPAAVGHFKPSFGLVGF